MSHEFPTSLEVVRDQLGESLSPDVLAVLFRDQERMFELFSSVREILAAAAGRVYQSRSDGMWRYLGDHPQLIPTLARPKYDGEIRPLIGIVMPRGSDDPHQSAVDATRVASQLFERLAGLLWYAHSLVVTDPYWQLEGSTDDPTVGAQSLFTVLAYLQPLVDAGLIDFIPIMNSTDHYRVIDDPQARTFLVMAKLDAWEQCGGDPDLMLTRDEVAFLGAVLGGDPAAEGEYLQRARSDALNGWFATEARARRWAGAGEQDGDKRRAQSFRLQLLGEADLPDMGALDAKGFLEVRNEQAFEQLRDGVGRALHHLAIGKATPEVEGLVAEEFELEFEEAKLRFDDQTRHSRILEARRTGVLQLAVGGAAVLATIPLAGSGNELLAVTASAASTGLVYTANALRRRRGTFVSMGRMGHPQSAIRRL